jgi:hypothetical protein
MNESDGTEQERKRLRTKVPGFQDMKGDGDVGVSQSDVLRQNGFSSRLRDKKTDDEEQADHHEEAPGED